MKKYGDRGGRYAEVDNTLRDLHNSLYDTKGEFNNCFIIHSKIIPSLKTWLKHAFLHRSIDVKFIFDSARLGLSSSAKYSPNSRCHPSSCLLAVLAMLLAIFSPSSYS